MSVGEGSRGQIVRRLRESLGKKGVDLAREIGISPAYLSEIERGVKSPSLPILSKIAEALGVKPSDLMEDSPISLVTMRNREGNPYVYYRCTPKHLAILEGRPWEGLHQGYMVRVDDLTKTVAAIVKGKVLGKDFMETLRDEIAEREKAQEESMGRLREGLERERSRIETRRSALAEAVLDGSIPRDVARRKQEELTTGLAEIDRQLDALDVAPPPHPIEDLRNVPARAIRTALETEKGLRSVLVALVARVEMSPDHTGRIRFTGLYPPEDIAVPRKRAVKSPIA